MEGFHEIDFQMSLVHLAVILVTYCGMEYLSWPLTFLLVVVIFCFYVHLDDQILAQPQTRDDSPVHLNLYLESLHLIKHL